MLAGLLFGIYSDAGERTCLGYPGSRFVRTQTLSLPGSCLSMHSLHGRSVCSRPHMMVRRSCTVPHAMNAAECQVAPVGFARSRMLSSSQHGAWTSSSNHPDVVLGWLLSCPHSGPALLPLLSVTSVVPPGPCPKPAARCPWHHLSAGHSRLRSLVMPCHPASTAATAVKNTVPACRDQTSSHRCDAGTTTAMHPVQMM